jgi:adenylate cyclase
MEKHLSFDVIHITRRIFQIFKTAIETHNGKIIETAGDGLYAVFGFEDSLAKAVSHAVEAGLQILDNLSSFNDNYAIKYFNHSFDVGIGLHAGTVIVGNIGLGISNNLTVMGLPVNMAARLQEATKEVNNSFLISEYAFSYINDCTEKFPSSEINLKGISEMQKVFLFGKDYN